MKDIENKKEYMKKINIRKSWFFEQINEIDKPLARRTKEIREKTHTNKIRSGGGEVTINISDIQSIILEYHE